jgi:hypothetical protein
MDRITVGDRQKRPEWQNRNRSRPEAILVKVGQGKEWLQVYRDTIRARKTIIDSSGIRRTRAGDILIELKTGSDTKRSWRSRTHPSVVG